jgi:hypothetical protein
MITPTVGRVVWYWPHVSARHSQPHAAIVAYVWGDNMVNLAVVDQNGTWYAATSVLLVQDDTVPESAHAAWMPYQKGQAAKTEELEKRAV